VTLKDRLHMTESQKKVLLQIAKKGPQTKYNVEKETKVNHASVHEAVQHFLHARIFQGEKVGVARTGLPKTKYKLTFLGVCLAMIVADSQDYDNITMNWGFLFPQVLGKWKHFKSIGFGTEFLEAFSWVLTWVFEWGYNREEWATERFWFFVFYMTAGAKKAKWLRALRMDPELRQWAFEALKETLVDGRELMRIHKKSLETLEMTSEPDWNAVTKDLRVHTPKMSEKKKAKAISWLKEETESLS